MKKYLKGKIGLGIVTYNRPTYFKQAIEGIMKHVFPLLDSFVIYNDGSDTNKKEEYRQIYDTLLNKEPPIVACDPPENKGVGTAKNWCIKQLLDAGCDYIFISEDDIVVQSPKAITGYIDLFKKTGIQHFNFAHHGFMNPKPDSIEGEVAYFPNCVGAWSFYTREVLEKVGLIDEHFKNAWDHVEHTARIARAGYTTPFWKFADATDSDKWIKEIPGAINNSAIRQNPQWVSQMSEGLAYWRNKDGIGIPAK